MNFIFGSSGFAKEVDWLINDISNAGGFDFSPHYFVSADEIGYTLNTIPVISEREFIEHASKSKRNNVIIGIGSPKIKEKIFTDIHHTANVYFPILTHPSLQYDSRDGKVTFENGCIICAGNIITTNVSIGRFVHINLDCTIGHDTRIGDFVTVSPGCHISGNVTIAKNVFIGTGAVILERISICENVIIGAASVVNKSIEEPGTYVGIPAKRIK